MRVKTLLLMIPLLFAAGGPAWGAQFSITASANAGGVVAPREGRNLVEEGADLEVVFSPRAGYHLHSVSIDGVAAAVTDRTSFSYRFSDIRKNGKISARFARNPAITVNHTAGGTIDSGKGKIYVPYSSSRTFIITPAAGHHTERVVVDGTNIGQPATFTFPSVQDSHSLKAVFAINKYAVALSAGSGGKITPAVTSAKHGLMKTFTVTPDRGMKIESVTVDGTSIENLPPAGPLKIARTITSDLAVSAVFAPLPASAADVFSRMPYLVFSGSATTMKVLWQATSATPATLAWGTDNSYGSGTLTATETTSDHRFAETITGLTPGTRYYYRVTQAETQASCSFYAAPPPDATRAKLFVLGDSRSNPDVHDALAGRMISAYVSNPEFQSLALYSGDIVEDGTSDGSWQSQLFSPRFTNLATMGSEVPRIIARGNHEGNGILFGKLYPYPFVKGMYWSFDYGPLHVVLADQYEPGGGMSDGQLDWIRNDLAASTPPWKIIMVHEPGWSAGGGHGNNDQVQAKIQPLAKEHGALVIAGHNHYYARAVVDGIHHITTGGAGAPLHSPDQGRPNVVIAEPSRHYCTIEVDGETLQFTAFRADGTVIETFSIARN